jgi:hypothetical protein
MSKSGGHGGRPRLCTDLTLGNSVVAIGWPRRFRSGSRPVAGRRPGKLLRRRYPFHHNYSSRLSTARAAGLRVGHPPQDSYLVDSASSHMLVSKIKPCMSKYKQLYGETANGSLNQLSFI